MNKETIVQKIESFKTLKTWRPNESSQPSGTFTHFLNEWCSHLETSDPLKASIAARWNRQESWKNLALENASPTLFILGAEEKWTEFWDALNNLPAQQSPLDICDEILDWGRSFLDKKSIAKLLQASGDEKKPQRRVLGVLPYEKGVLSLVLVGLPACCLTPLHSHPECLAETLLSGEVAELRFTQPNPDAFRYEKLEHLGFGDKTLCHSDSGTPHMMYAKTKDVVSLAVFAGDRPIEYFPKQIIENPEDLENAIKDLEMKH